MIFLHLTSAKRHTIFWHASPEGLRAFFVPNARLFRLKQQASRLQKCCVPLSKTCPHMDGRKKKCQYACGKRIFCLRFLGGFRLHGRFGKNLSYRADCHHTRCQNICSPFLGAGVSCPCAHTPAKWPQGLYGTGSAHAAAHTGIALYQGHDH